MQIEGKYLLLTGATGGIGQAIARELDKAGIHLLLTGRNQEKLTQLQQSLASEHSLVVADMNSQDGRAAIIAAAQQVNIELFVNASGVMNFNLYEQQDSALIENMLTTNLLSPMLLCQQLIPLLKQHREAAIINIGSIFGSIGHPGFSAYCASKFGLRGFTEALQRELADSTVRVSYLAPRATRTDLNASNVNALNDALGNTTDAPELVAKHVMNLLSGSHKQCYMGWPEKLFVRVNGLLPGIVDKALVKKLPLIKKYVHQQG